MSDSNRSPDRYKLPDYLGREDTRDWVSGMPFFLGSAVKYVWRGWDSIDDMKKALDSLRIHRRWLKNEPYTSILVGGISCLAMGNDLQNIKQGDIANAKKDTLFCLGNPDKADHAEKMILSRIRYLESVMTNPELKPCPWCGNTDFLYPAIDHQYKITACENCYGQGPACRSHEEAAIKWNTRAGEK